MSRNEVLADPPPCCALLLLASPHAIGGGFCWVLDDADWLSLAASSCCGLWPLFFLLRRDFDPGMGTGGDSTSFFFGTSSLLLVVLVLLVVALVVAVVVVALLVLVATLLPLRFFRVLLGAGLAGAAAGGGAACPSVRGTARGGPISSSNTNRPSSVGEGGRVLRGDGGH